MLSGKLALKYVGSDLDAMKAIADSAHKRSLFDFQAAIGKFPKELQEDVVVKSHLSTLYDNMMEQNLCRIIEPYSKVQVSIKLLEIEENKIKKRFLIMFCFYSRLIILQRLLGFVKKTWSRNCPR